MSNNRSPRQTEGVWRRRDRAPDRDPTTDVCVIGAGMAGLLALAGVAATDVLTRGANPGAGSYY